jgi:hypothetical protein
MKLLLLLFFILFLSSCVFHNCRPTFNFKTDKDYSINFITVGITCDIKE